MSCEALGQSFGGLVRELRVLREGNHDDHAGYTDRHIARRILCGVFMSETVPDETEDTLPGPCRVSPSPLLGVRPPGATQALRPRDPLSTQCLRIDAYPCGQIA